MVHKPIHGSPHSPPVLRSCRESILPHSPLRKSFIANVSVVSIQWKKVLVPGDEEWIRWYIPPAISGNESGECEDFLIPLLLPWILGCNHPRNQRIPWHCEGLVDCRDPLGASPLGDPFFSGETLRKGISSSHRAHSTATDPRWWFYSLFYEGMDFGVCCGMNTHDWNVQGGGFPMGPGSLGPGTRVMMECTEYQSDPSWALTLG